MLSAPFIVSVSLWKHGNRVEWRTGAIPGSQAKHLGYRWGDTQRREQMIQARRTYRRYLQGEAKIRVQGFKPKFREQKRCCCQRWYSRYFAASTAAVNQLEKAGARPGSPPLCQAFIRLSLDHETFRGALDRHYLPSGIEVFQFKN